MPTAIYSTIPRHLCIFQIRPGVNLSGCIIICAQCSVSMDVLANYAYLRVLRMAARILMHMSAAQSTPVMRSV